MTITEFILKATNKIKPVKKMAQSICRYAVTHTNTRKWLNKFYNKLNQKERIVFHYFFARIFRNKKSPPINAVWTIQFNGKDIQMPLRTESLWLDWDLAVSIMGHDLEIKYFYEKLIHSKKPATFFDIGANYGTHSLLFLSQGIKAITFEPNPDCKPIFEGLLNANSVTGQAEQYAIGETNSFAELVFPKTDTWNGTLQANYLGDLSTFQDITRIKVEIISLDNYVARYNIKPDIIKIDTEGFELNVLKGARKTLQESHPVIVFESNKSSEREDLFKELDSSGYNIYDIEKYFTGDPPYVESVFIHSGKTNFVAISKEKGLA
jgi:FkbM family methyltransferase